MLSLGIGASTIEKYLALGFDIIKSKDDKKAAQKRCKTIDVYYLEKLTLLDQSKAASNPAGFFINALKEDWKSPHLFQRVKTDSKRKQQKLAKQNILKLEAKEEKLLKTHDKQRQALLDDIIKKNEKEFLSIYDSIENNHAIIKYKKAGLSPSQNYKESVFLRAKMNEILTERDKPTFIEVDELYKKIEKIRDEISQLKKEWNI